MSKFAGGFAFLQFTIEIFNLQNCLVHPLNIVKQVKSVEILNYLVLKSVVFQNNEDKISDDSTLIQSIQVMCWSLEESLILTSQSLSILYLCCTKLYIFFHCSDIDGCAK